MIAADKDALAMARKSAEAMWSADRATAALGMEIRAIARGEATLAEAIAKGQADTRAYAKRQLTWFRHQMTGGEVVTG